MATLKKDRKLFFKTNYRFMQVNSIAFVIKIFTLSIF